MKKLTLIPVAIMACAAAYGQGTLSGTVGFNNGSTSLLTTLINGVAGSASSASGGFQVDLFYQSDGGGAAPAPITSTGILGQWQSAAIIGLSAHPNGAFAGGSTILPGITANANVWVEVVGWNNNAGSLANALSAGTAELFGNSAVFSLATGNPNLSPPGTPPTLASNPAFTGLVLSPLSSPEPTTLALGALGAASLLAFRRRK